MTVPPLEMASTRWIGRSNCCEVAHGTVGSSPKNAPKCPLDPLGAVSPITLPYLTRNASPGARTAVALPFHEQGPGLYLTTSRTTMGNAAAIAFSGHSRKPSAAGPAVGWMPARAGGPQKSSIPVPACRFRSSCWRTADCRVQGAVSPPRWKEHARGQVHVHLPRQS